MFLQIKHYFHDQIREIVEKQNTAEYKVKHGSDVVLAIIAIVRLFAAFYIYYKLDAEQFHYDYLVNFVTTNGYQKYQDLGLVFILFSVLIIVGKQCFFFSPVDTLAFQLFYDILVRNRASYARHMVSSDRASQLCILSKRQAEAVSWTKTHFALIPVDRIPSLIVHKLSMQAARLLALRQLDLVDRRKFYMDRLVLFPSISLNNRATLLLVLHVVDLGNFALQLSILLTILTGVALYYPKFVSISSWWQQPMLLFELFGQMDLFTTLVQVGTLTTCVGVFAALVYGMHLRELAAMLAKIRRRVQSGRRLDNFHHSLLQFVYREHSEIAYKVIYTNRHQWGKVLYMYLLVSIPLNGYMVSLLLLDNSFDYFDQMGLLMAITIHIVATAIPLLKMASISWHLHRSGKYIPTIQAAMGRCHLANKIKYDDLFGRLTRGRKQAFTLGPMVSLTYTSVFELAITYVGVFIFLLENIRSLRISIM